MKNLLVIIDMINGFVKEGILADKNINHITPNIINKINEFNNNGDDIICFQDAHTNTSNEFKDFPPHCLKDSFESELIDELIPYKNKMKIIYKNSTSGFVTKEFLEYIEQNKDDLNRVVIAGCCTDICIINFAIPLKNYFNEYNLDVDVIVPKTCVETYNSDTHNREEYNEMSFKLMKQTGIKIEE